jgi:subtilisin family serine protease
MRKSASLLASMVIGVVLGCGVAIAHAQASPSASTGAYIVVLKDRVPNPEEAAQTMARSHGLGVGLVYSNALKGFSAYISDRRLEQVRSDSRVAYVESDQIAYAEVQALPWGTDRVGADLSSTRAGDGSGTVSNVHAYIIDSGIDKTHPDLNVVKHVNFTGDGKNTDCDGHGTHVAGTVAAKDNSQDVVGVAPGIPLTGVKVLDWVTANARKPAIANMSLGAGGGTSQALDDAIRKSAKSGVFYSVVAGNKGEDACLHSPARAGAGIDNGIATVAATDEFDQEASFSNYGSCVDIWAPGVRILSTRLGGGTTTMGGTSMAAPHVGGGGALYLSSHTRASSSVVESALTNNALRPGMQSKDGRAILLENVRIF